MGRNDSFGATYGRGRYRYRVVTTDVWNADDDVNKNVFSFSSGQSTSLSSTDSDLSLVEACKKPDTTGKKKRKIKSATTAIKKNQGVNKENRYAKKTSSSKKGKKFTVFSETEKDSCSSTGGESLILPKKTATGRILRERNVPSDTSTSSAGSLWNSRNEPPHGRQRPTRNRKTNNHKQKDDASYNFSEFEDYSFVFSSGTPQNQRRVAKSKKADSGIETSTPFRCKSTKVYISQDIKDANISLIDSIEDSPAVSEPRSSPSMLDSLCSASGVGRDGSNFGASPSLIVTNAPTNKLNSNSCSIMSENNATDITDGDVKMRLLEENVKNMHINDRRRNYPYQNLSGKSLTSFQQSQSLFDSPLDVKSSQSSKLIMSSHNSSSPFSCVVRLQKIQESFLRANLLDGQQSPVASIPFCKYNTRSASKQSNPSSVRKLRSRSVYTSGSSFEAIDDESVEKILQEMQEEEEEEELVEEEESSNEEEDDDDLSDILEDEDEDDVESEGETGREKSEVCSGRLSDSDGSLSGDDNLDSSGELASLLSNSGIKEMDTSYTNSRVASRSVYYSADSDMSYKTADGSCLAREDNCRNARSKQLDNVREMQAEEDDLSRSFAEMLTPRKKSKTSPSTTPRGKLFHLCGQTAPLCFRDIIPDNMMKKIVKIGEGVYGEVFRAHRDNKSVAIKIIPIEGDFEVNDEPQKTFAEILPEVVISKELCNLHLPGNSMSPSFCQVNSAACVKGCYPAALLKQWDVYHKKRKSENDRPDMFNKNQLFIVFEFADGGADLEGFQFDSPWQAWSVLQQVSVSLAVAEDVLEFEHRDLHIGNVLVRSTDSDSDLEYQLVGQHIDVDTHGIIVSIIDFTLSRLRKDGCTVFCDLTKDDALFEGTGDYQFDIYRNMKQENKNDWEAFCPHSNVWWLHYLCDKLLKQKYKNGNSRGDREPLRKLRQFQAAVLEYTSAKHLVLESELFPS